VELLRTRIDRSTLKVVEGELRDGPIEDVTGNALTTRLYIKQLNKKAQNLLIRQAEPICAMNAITGLKPYAMPYFDRAWKYMLDSHPHDSINGVTQDKTANDVVNRLEQVIDISNTMTEEALREITKNIDLSYLDKNEMAVVVFNPLPYDRQEIVEAWLNMPIPQSKVAAWGKDRYWVEMFDADKNPIGVQSNGYTQEVYPVSALHTRSLPYYTMRYKVYFDTGNIPAGGYKVFRAQLADSQTFGEAEHLSNSLSRTNTILAGCHTLENEYLKIEINPNGTFNLTDKTLENTFFGLNYYEDRGEIGDYWINKRPVEDKVFSSLGARAKIWSEDCGALSASLVSEVAMNLPKSGLLKMEKRSDAFEDLVIRTRLTLRKGARQLEVNVEFENRHHDHALRAMFPTGIEQAKHSYAGGHFIVDKRSIRPAGPTDHSVWPDMATLPHNNFVDITDGKIGLAFLNDCLTEYEVIDNSERTVALSLLRAVRNWICTETRVGSTFENQKGGQCLGNHKLRYWIRPHKGNWQDENLPLEGLKANMRCTPVQTNKHSGRLQTAQKSFFKIDNELLQFSAIKPSETGDNWIVRLYNPTESKQKSTITFTSLAKNAWLTNLEERRIKPVAIDKNGDITVEAEPYKIITVEIDFDKTSTFSQNSRN
jgi:mannosylglycerate hydrolase